MTEATLTLRCDATPLLAEIARLEALLAQASDAFAKARDALIDDAQFAAEFAAVEVDPDAAGAGEVVVVLQPGDGFRRLLAAAGARNAD